jgi:hypothetical protein
MIDRDTPLHVVADIYARQLLFRGTKELGYMCWRGSLQLRPFYNLWVDELPGLYALCSPGMDLSPRHVFCNAVPPPSLEVRRWVNGNADYTVWHVYRHHERQIAAIHADGTIVTFFIEDVPTILDLLPIAQQYAAFEEGR